jgi:hypothetical protein
MRSFVPSKKYFLPKANLAQISDEHASWGILMGIHSTPNPPGQVAQVHP